MKTQKQVIISIGREFEGADTDIPEEIPRGNELPF